MVGDIILEIISAVKNLPKNIHQCFCIHKYQHIECGRQKCEKCGRISRW